MAKRKVNDWQVEEFVLEMQLGFMIDELFGLSKAWLERTGMAIILHYDDPEIGTSYEVEVERSGRISVFWVLGEWKQDYYGWHWRITAEEEGVESSIAHLIYLHGYISEIHKTEMKKKK